MGAPVTDHPHAPDEADVFAALSEVYTLGGCVLWWRCRNRALDGRTPLGLWRDGDRQRVYDLARSLSGMVAT